MREARLYFIIRPFVKFITNVFLRPKYVGLSNIPTKGRVILAGVHTSIMDPLLLMSATKRSIHFLAKDELWHGPKRILFSNLGLIPVNRRTKDHAALAKAIEYLENDLVVGIFPEGTTEKGRGLLPFKMGAVKMAYEANAKIVPFVITGKYHLFSKKLKITFGSPIVVGSDIAKENDRLRSIIEKMLLINIGSD